MITAVFGESGKGKTSLVSYFCKTRYFDDGNLIFRKSCKLIDNINVSKGLHLTKPDRVPFFSDHEIKFKIGYEKYFSTFFINGFYLALENKNFDSLFVPPGSVIYLSEVQRYYDSRKSNSRDKLPDAISRFFEMHRHFGLDIYLDLQRIRLLDANIRENTRRFILVKDMENKLSNFGGIIQTTWHCLEFDSWEFVDKYLDNPKNKGYREVDFVYDGNIFKTFNSCSYFDEFLPGFGEDFQYLEHNKTFSGSDDKTIKFYNFSGVK